MITAWGVRWTGLPHSPKTNGDNLIKDNLGRYCLKTFETTMGKKKGSAAGNRTRALSHECSANKPQHPPVKLYILQCLQGAVNFALVNGSACILWVKEL